MSKTFSSGDVIELALEKVGDKSLYDQQASKDSMRTGLRHLDLILAEWAGTRLWQHLSPMSRDVTLVADQSAYNLAALFSSSTPILVTQVRLNTGDIPVRLIGQREFENWQNTGGSGEPEVAYVDTAGNGLVLNVRPTPAVAGGKLRVITQVAVADVSSNPQGSIAHGFPQYLQRALVHQLAHDLGDGPIARRETVVLDRWAVIARQAVSDCIAGAGRSQVDYPRFTEPYE